MGKSRKADHRARFTLKNMQQNRALPLPQCAAQCGKHAHLLGRMCRLGTPRLCKACPQVWSCRSRSPAQCSCREMTDTQQGLCTDWGRIDRGAELQRKVMRSQVCNMSQPAGILACDFRLVLQLPCCHHILVRLFSGTHLSRRSLLGTPLGRYCSLYHRLQNCRNRSPARCRFQG